jgi:hypothetical protein
MILEQSGGEGDTVGGPGSGNFNHKWRPPKKTTAEECLSLDASEWTCEGILRAGVRRAGIWHWIYPSGRECSIGYEMNTLDGADAWVRLDYSCRVPPPGPALPESYTVGLTTTRPPYAGLRWWFVCPLESDGRPCSRRVRKLYLPTDSTNFGCRHGHRLSYTSSQRSRYDDPVFRRLARHMGLDFAGVNGMMRGYGKPGWNLIG